MNLKAFISLAVAIFVAMMGMGIVSPLMGIYATELGASGVWLGVMYSAFSLSRAIFMPFIGGLSDRRGRKNIMVTGLIVYAVVSILYSLASNIYQLAVFRFLHGAASAMVIPIAQAYVGVLIPKGKEGTYMNLFTMSMFLGMGAGPLLGGTLADIFNLNAVFYVTCGFATIALLLLVPLVPRAEPQLKKKRGLGVPMTTLIRDNKVKAIGIYLASRGIIRQGIIAFLPLYTVTRLGMSTSSIGGVLSLFMLASAVTQGMFGPLADRYNKTMMMILGGLTAPLFVFLLPNVSSPLTILLVLVPIAMLTSMARASAMAYNVQVGAKYGRMGSAIGIVMSAMSIGQFLGPLAAGFIMDQYGIKSVFIFQGVVGISLALIMAYWLFQKEAPVDLNLEAKAEPAPGQR
jgi:MFS family permease